MSLREFFFLSRLSNERDAARRASMALMMINEGIELQIL